MIIVSELLFVQRGIVASLFSTVLTLVALHVFANLVHPAVVVGGIHTRLLHDELDAFGYRRGHLHSRAQRGEFDQVAVVLVVTVDLQIQVIEVPEQLRMDALHVIRLVECIDRGFPVAIPLHSNIPRHRHAGHVVRLEMLRNDVEVIGQRLDVRIQAEPHPAVPDRTWNLFEPLAWSTLWKRVEVRDILEGTVEFVFPMVVCALERRSVTESPIAQSIAAVLADVVEGTHAAVVLAHQQYRLRPYLGGAIRARLVQVALETADEPDLGPDMLPLGLHERSIRIALLRDDAVAELGVRRLLQRRTVFEALAVDILSLATHSAYSCSLVQRVVKRPANAATQKLIECRLLPAAALGLRVFIHQRLHVVAAACVTEVEVEDLARLPATQVHNGHDIVAAPVALLEAIRLAAVTCFKQALVLTVESAQVDLVVGFERLDTGNERML